MKILIKNTTAAIRRGNGVYSSEKADICIDGSKIIAVGEAPSGFVPDKIIDGNGKLAVPGFVNAHTHVYMTCFRSFADDLPFAEWLFGRISPNEDKMTPDEAYTASLLGCAEMVRSGVTAFLEMHMFPGKVADAATETGMRVCLSRGLVGNGNDEAGASRLKQAFDEMSDYSGTPNISFMLAAHAIYTTDADFLRIVSQKATEAGLPIHIHVSESEYEVSQCYEKHGVSPVEYLENLGILDHKIVAAHCVHLSDNDIAILARHGVNVALCPRSNLKLGNGIAPVKKMLDAGINLCIGTDSAASNNTLNMFPDMSMTALLHKGLNGDASAVTAGQVLDMATYNGAKALGLNSGELAVGKDADIVLFDTDCPQFLPRNDLISALCYSANGSETDTVIINGEIVFENGRLTKINEKALYNQADALIKGITDR